MINDMSCKELQLAVSDRCNNNCIFCTDKHAPKHQEPFTFENIKKSIDLFAKSLSVRSIFITSNEPTINKDIFRILKYIKSKGLSASLNTNAKIFSEKRNVIKVAKLGISEFRISIHGHNSKVHDSITRTPKSFEQTVVGIKNIISLGSYVSTNTVICSQNFKFLPEILLFLHNLGVPKIDFFGVKPVGNANINFDLTVPKFSDVAPYLEKLYKTSTNNNIKFSLSNFPSCFLNQKILMKNQKITPFYFYTSNLELNLDTFTERVETRKCKTCKHLKLCGGVYREYLEKYGVGEFE